VAAMILLGDVTHGYLIARAAHTGFDNEVDRVISRMSEDGRFLGGVIFTGFTGSMVMLHVAGIGNWASPELVWLMFDYPFMQLKVKKVVCTAGSDNKHSIDIIERVGFKLEHKIADGIPGGTLNLYSMLREDCRWLKLRSRYMRLNGHGEGVHVHA
jgi:RimJ/RimL family protein N-acetyltransferase